MHLRPVARQGERQAAPQSAQGLVPQPRRGHDQRRRRGDLPCPSAAAGPDHPARFRLFADLSLPRVAARHAHPSDRHRSVQIRRIQAERTDQGGAQPRLLETGPALPRRHRVHDRAEPLDRDPGLCRRQVRHDLALYPDRPAAKGHQEPGPAGDLRAANDRMAPPIFSSTATSRPSTMPICGGRWCSPWTANPLSTF